MERVEAVVSYIVKTCRVSRDVIGLTSLYLLVYLALKLGRECDVIDYIMERL